MSDKVFDRIEKKYLITDAQRKAMLDVISRNMHEDNYFRSKVFNIYFDNENYDLIVQSIDRPLFKEKLRARSYGGYDRVFLEIKTKLLGKDANPGFKRRVMITKKDFEEFINGTKNLVTLAKKTIEKEDDLQIASEVDYLAKRFDLKPRIMVIYGRESYKGEDNLRVTFDTDLKYRLKDFQFKAKKSDKIYFKDKCNIIMEVKAHGVLPLWLVKAMSKNKVYPQQFSKVGRIYEKLKKEENV